MHLARREFQLIWSTGWQQLRGAGLALILAIDCRVERLKAKTFWRPFCLGKRIPDRRVAFSFQMRLIDVQVASCIWTAKFSVLSYRLRVGCSGVFCPLGFADGIGCVTISPSVMPSTHLMASKYIVRMSGSFHDSGVWPREE